MRTKAIIHVDWENNYGAYTDLLPGCAAPAATYEQVQKEMKMSIEMHLQGMKEDGQEPPAVFTGEYELVFEMNVRALLHKYEGILTRSALSRITRINERQLGHYATGRSKPRPEQRKRIIEGIHRLGRELITIE